MAQKVFGIDFGSDSTKIYRKGQGVVYNQKSVIAFKNHTKILAIGDEAFEMFGKTPESINVTFPIAHGVINSFANMLSLLNCMFLDLERVFGKFRGSEYYVAVPSDITEVEKKAFYDLVDGTLVRPKRIRLVEKPIADAIGAGVDIVKSQGTMVVNIGSETTEISIISLGGILFSKLLPIGGRTFNENIINMIRRKYNLLIGEKTAESLKLELANFSSKRDDSMNAFGRDLVTGLPRESLVTTELVNDAISESMQSIFENIRVILDRTPPEIAADVYHNGICLTGGSANLPGLSFLFSTNLGNNKVTVSDFGVMTVTNGLAKIMEDRYYDRYAVSLKQALAEDKIPL
ncbi:MAG: rod shape-determining protein [Lachnospiraceae bacterium]|nr:rod shape-determining protein [Lachnospiraceae bacterium]